MALTDKCDLFGAVHEKGVNRVTRHMMRQRPSLFNYGTADGRSKQEAVVHEGRPAPPT